MANSTTAEHAVIRRDISKFKWTMMQMKQHKVAYLMIAPFFILFFIFTVVPVLLSVILSFTTFNLLEWPTLVYADNYIRLFLDDEIFLIAVKNTLMFAIITGPEASRPGRERLFHVRAFRHHTPGDDRQAQPGRVQVSSAAGLGGAEAGVGKLQRPAQPLRLRRTEAVHADEGRRPHLPHQRPGQLL